MCSFYSKGDQMQFLKGVAIDPTFINVGWLKRT